VRCAVARMNRRDLPEKTSSARHLGAAPDAAPHGQLLPELLVEHSGSAHCGAAFRAFRVDRGSGRQVPPSGSDGPSTLLCGGTTALFQ
jgi:hypothetical protein